MNSIVDSFNSAYRWFHTYSRCGSGIAISSTERKPYPEVSGYYIPSLLQWNEKERALAYANWLLTIQNPDGSWMGSHPAPYAFDSGQILKGLVATYERLPSDSLASAIAKGCDWITSHIDSTGSMASVPDIPLWAGSVPDGILLYSLEPIRRAAKIFSREDWHERVEKAIAHFLSRKELAQFTELTLSHFHAYICEALCDLGHHDRAAEAMQQIAQLQRANGSVPAYPNVRWICSTGLIQYAIIWYKLGIRDRADAALDFAVGLQNPSGGWYGSYASPRLQDRICFRNNAPKYFPKAEISWAVKFFLDALHLKLQANFDDDADVFLETIAEDDGRFTLVEKLAKETERSTSGGGTLLEVGCGKGRYLRRLNDLGLTSKLCGTDISERVMASIPSNIECKKGALLDLPYPENSFDFVFTCEALEHCVHLDGAVRELTRVVKPGGTLLIIDKDKEKLGALQMPPWEQWFGREDLAMRLEKLGFDTVVHANVPYEGKADGLFVGWEAKKRISC